jgi:hypothetical protein
VLVPWAYRWECCITHVWAREKNRRTTGHIDRKRAIEQKESHRWLESLELTQQWIPQDKKVVTVADREADIYELLALPRP